MTEIKIGKDGPYLVSVGVKLSQAVITQVGHHKEYVAGSAELEQGEQYALCRCGHSSTMPFCDGTHARLGFVGTETASREPFEERVEVFEGPTLDLLDDGRCAYARFCHREGGDVWTLTENSDDPELRAQAIQAANDCPSGRLVQLDNTAEYAEHEPEYAEQEIVLLEDPEQQCSGPLFVKGRIPLVGADGHAYELRNRYALCRCGASLNKPFCDARHINCRFDDGLV